MSKNRNETYDVTEDAANDTLSRMKEFYAKHPAAENQEDGVAINFGRYMELVVKGWKVIEYERHPYDYNRQMAKNSDRSPAALRNYYNKK